MMRRGPFMLNLNKGMNIYIYIYISGKYSYGHFGGSDKNMHRIKAHGDSRNIKSNFHCI